MSSKTILVATREIHGGTTGKEGSTLREVLQAGTELTDAKKKALGLDKEGIAALVASGALLEQQARLAGSEDTVDSATHRAAVERADKAEQDLEGANASLTDLQTKLDAANVANAELQTKLDAATAAKK
jgi:hypothetical protein